MKDKIDQIRGLLVSIEHEEQANKPDSFERNFDALELPSLISQVVDFLQPRLLPYEAAIYWYLFRHSIVANGTQRLRASVRGLCEGVITSSSGQSTKLSYSSVQDALRGLEEREAIRKDGDTTREGTPYLVRLPEEITWCVELIRANETVSKAPVSVGDKETDYYNIAENRLKLFERDFYKCRYCSKQLTRFSATLDHIQPVSKGGTNSSENLVTSCLHCNSRRGNQPVMEALKKL